MFPSQLKNKDLCQFPNVDKHSECAVDNGSLAKYVEKNKLLQVSFDSRYHDVGKE